MVGKKFLNDHYPKEPNLALKPERILVWFLVAGLAVNTLILPVSAEPLLKDDFKQPYFAKTVDFFEYARAWAVLKGLPEPPQHWHANVYMTYVNQSGFQLLYAGLHAIRLTPNVDLTIPLQTILMHYKTQETNQDALVASSFLMLMGFNDSDSTLHAGTPDKNDTLWASFNLGLNLTQRFPHTLFPAFNSGSEILEFSHASEGNGVETWEWGMRYKNLTALWVTTDLADEGNTQATRPFGLATYDELTFKYTLTLSPEGTATLHKDYVLGCMHDLFVFGGWFLIWPIYNHYNSTGCFRYNVKVSDVTIYDFLEANDVSMSIVEYQKVVLLDKETHTLTEDGDDVSEDEIDVSTSSLSTYSEDNELICSHDFNAKLEYQLYNLSNPEPTTYPAVVWTHNITGYARNRDLFQVQTSFQRYVPLILVGMYPQAYQQTKDAIADMTVADCLYVISYPHYGGYKIDHDPVLTAYFTPTQALDPLTQLKGPLLLVVMAVPILAVVVLLRKRRTTTVIKT